MLQIGSASETDVLLVVDVQLDFMPGGALAVPEGDAVVPGINHLLGRFSHAVATQDWHPPGHASFASAHPGKNPFETTRLSYGEQTLWPDHCVQASAGAAFHPALDLRRIEMVIRKGFRAEIDSYSGFRENDRRTKTGLHGYLQERGFRRVFITGLARDYCVQYTAMDARELGYEVIVVENCCRAIDPAAAETARRTLAQRGGTSLKLDAVA
jgi:nicotinamidase/pyrazinamidase